MYTPLTREQYNKALNAGFTPEQIIQMEKKRKNDLPLLTKDTGGIGTAARDVAVGAAKGFVRGARDLAGLFQGGGQRIIAGVTGQKYADVKANTGVKALDDSTVEGAGVAESLRSRSRGEQVGGILELGAEIGTGAIVTKAPQTVARGAKAVQTAAKARATTKATKKVTEMITPKPTVKEAKLAQTEGRLVEGKAPTLFKAGTDDTILPSQKTLGATKVIVEKIPNASKMKPAELYKAVDSEITKTAENLRPQMKITPIKEETIVKINKDWEALKKVQLEAADATEEANVIKIQNQFEQRLMKAGNQSQDDLWQARIDYDASIPDNVKKANALSSESLQNKKEIWLQNRAILNDAINDTASGMGDVTKKAFGEMSNLYEARNSLLSKAKVDKAQLSKINQFLKDNPKVAKVLGGATIYIILKKLGVPLP